MAKWLGNVPTYERQIIDKPAGIKQQVYWRDQSLKAPGRSDVHQYAVRAGGHLNKFVMGFKKEGINKKPPNALANAGFGSGLLAPQASAADFKLKTSEFDNIISWVKRTPEPPGATDAIHGSVLADSRSIIGGDIIDCKRRDALDQRLKSERNVRDWTEYFSSPEYLKTIGIK